MRITTWITARYKTVVALACALYLAQAFDFAVSHSVTGDELSHVLRGYMQWTRPALKHPSENGVLSQRVQTLPLTLLHLQLPTRKSATDAQGRTMPLEQAFLYRAGNPRWLLVVPRMMNALFGVMLGLCIFAWSRQLFGVAGGLLSLALWALSPNFIAHGAIATPDLAAALFFALSTYTLARTTRELSWGNVAASSLSVAALTITKMSFLVILPIALAIVALRVLDPAPVQLRVGPPRQLDGAWSRLGYFAAIACLHVAVVIGVVWLTYDFSTSAIQLPNVLALRDPDLKARVVASLHAFHVLPRAFLEGLSGALWIAGGKPAFLAGYYSSDGWWWFFPYAFLIKTPLATLLLILSAPLAWALTPRHERVPLTELAPALVLFLIFGAVCVTSSLNIGDRHMLPIYPPLLVLCGSQASGWGAHAQRAHAIVAALVVCTFVACLSIRPHYLAFFNSLIGGPKQGHHQLVDSSLDWGQDLPALREFLDRQVVTRDPRDRHTRVYLSYFGWGSPEAYGIRSERLPGWGDQGPARPPGQLRPGVYCISASMLSGVFLQFSGPWTERLETIYQDARRRAAAWTASERDPALREQLLRTHDARYYAAVLAAHEQLRFARLCAYLRTREPDAWVGYSILVFRLGEAELRRALENPVAYR